MLPANIRWYISTEFLKGKNRKIFSCFSSNEEKVTGILDFFPSTRKTTCR